MTTITTVITTCDRCDTEVDDGREVRFSMQGHDYVLDLCQPCSETFNAMVGPFIAIAQRGHPRRANYSIRFDR